MLLCGQTSSTSHCARGGCYHTWRFSPPPCQRGSASLTCWRSAGAICLTQIREYSYIGRPEVLAESEEKALQAGGTITLCRPELHLEGSDAIDVPVSADTILLLLVLLHMRPCVCKTFMHILAFVFAWQRGKKHLGERSLHLCKKFYHHCLQNS